MNEHASPHGSIVSRFRRHELNGGGRRDNALVIAPTPFVWRDPATIPMRQWLYGRHFIRGYASATVAPPGVGKSSLGFVEDVAMTTAKALLGHIPEETLRVWSWNGEDPRDEMERRIAAINLHYSVTERDIGGRLFLDSGRDQEIIISKAEKGGFVIAQPIVSAVTQAIRDCRIDLLRIDPFVSSHRVQENDNNAIDATAKTWAKIAHETNCAIDLVHHTRKLGDGDATAEDARGGSSLLGAVRSMRILNGMSKDAAQRAGINEEDRYEYFRLDIGKANMARRSRAPEWFQLVPVPLGNGGLLDGDEVGVATRWTWPNPLDGLSTHDLRKVQERIAEGEWAENSQANNWVGRAVAEAIGLNAEKDASRIKSLLRTWVGNGALRIDLRYVKRDGRDRKFIVVGERA